MLENSRPWEVTHLRGPTTALGSGAAMGGRQEVLLPWSSQSMGQGYESGRTDTAAEPPRRSGGSGKVSCWPQGQGFLQCPGLVCVCWGVCVKRASHSASSVLQKWGFTALPGRRGGREHFSSSHRQGAWSSGCPELLLTVLRVAQLWIREGVRHPGAGGSSCDQQLPPTPSTC